MNASNRDEGPSILTDSFIAFKSAIDDTETAMQSFHNIGLPTLRSEIRIFKTDWTVLYCVID